MKILYKITFLMTICFFISNAAHADAKSVTVDGFCYLDDAGDHSGTKVLFTAVSPSAQNDSILTNADGSYLIGLAEGIYTVKFSHDGYQPYTVSGEVAIFVNTTLDDVTLTPGLVFEISGPQSGVWESGNLYEVVGDISVAAGEELTIEPGVTVKFMDYYSFIINGTIVANGIVTDSIYFVSGQANQSPGDWVGIQFANSLNEDNIISFALIESAEKGVLLVQSSGTISNNQIRNNDFNGISCSYSSPMISYNRITNNGSGAFNHCGIHCDWDSSPIIDHNVIMNNEKIGIRVHYGSLPTISYNTIQYHEYQGIDCDGSSLSPLIHDNTITNSTRGIYASNSSPHIIRNILLNNVFGIQLYNSYSEITNNIISMNENGILCSTGSLSSIMNNVLSDNNIGVSFSSVPAEIVNNLFWQNNSHSNGDFPPPSFGEIVTVNLNGDPCDPYFNLFMDPLFVDPGNLDFHLTGNSPCIDAGDPDPANYDPDGTIADIGAFYYDQTILPPVIFDFLGEPTKGVANLLVQFSSEVSGQINSYSWEFGDGGTSSLMTPSYTYTKAGSFRVKLTVSGPGGNTTLSKPGYISVFDPQLIPQPDFSADPVSGYAPLEVEFTNLTIGDFESLLWDFGDGITSTDINPNHEYQSIGLFSVSLTAYNSHGYDTETKFDYIEVLESEEVTAAFEVSGNYGCSPFTVTFTNQSAGTINSYLWDFGDGETSTEENPVHTFIGAIEYTVLLTATGPINTDTAEQIITVELAEPLITSILDRPNDQGGYVYLMFNKSFYDNVVPEVGSKSTEGYSFQRLDNGDWVSLTYLYATGEDNYSVELTTLADSNTTSNEMASFRVIAGMDEGTWVSEAAEGYSVDNIAPSVPENFEGLFTDGQIELQWQPCPDEDFQYFAIYKTNETGQFEEEPFASTISNQVTDVFGAADCSYKVLAFDYNGNQSPTSEILVAQQINIVGGWISLSAYVDPSHPEMENVFNGIDDELIIIQNMTGSYWPAQNMNTLGDWDNNSGYFIKSTSDDSIPIIGKSLVNRSLTLNEGWNLIPVLSECSVSISELFDQIDVVIIKEIAGTKMFWPEAGVITLEELLSGKAYFVKINEPGTIFFPDCAEE